MSELPKRIWAYEDRDGFGKWTDGPDHLDPRYKNEYVTAYLRADLAPAPVVFDDIHKAVATIVDGEEMWSAYDVAQAIHAMLTKGRGGV